MSLSLSHQDICIASLIESPPSKAGRHRSTIDLHLRRSFPDSLVTVTLIAS